MNYRIGVDIGGTTIKVGILKDNVIINKRVFDTPEDFGESIKTIYDKTLQMTNDMKLSISDFPCIGVGIPSVINKKAGHLSNAVNLKWDNVPIYEELKKYFSIPVYVGNDADCAAIGEYIAGIAKGCKNVIMITLGTGVGGGIIIDGKLFNGSDGMGAEVGHTPFIFKGETCACGAKGCFEAYASATALIKQATTAAFNHPESSMNDWLKDNNELSGKVIFDCVRAGDEVAEQVVNQYADYVSYGLIGFENVFRPDIIVIGGGLSNAGDYLLKLIRDNFIKNIGNQNLDVNKLIQKALLGNDAGIIGAANMDNA